MISSKSVAGRRIGDLRNEKLLRDIDVINKSIYPERSRPRSSISSSRTVKNQVSETKSKLRHGSEESQSKDKKSFWNWKPLKAFSHIRNRRFNCSFSLLVHSIEALPPSFSDVNLRVHWKRRDGELVTRSARVLKGAAQFEEELTTVCSVYGSRSGPHHSAKYEAKHFLVFASICEASEIDLGKQRVDLTRLLPLTLEELEEDRSSGKWSTSYKLSGKAKGAVLNVSFMYSVVGESPPSNPLRKCNTLHKSIQDLSVAPLKNSELSKSVDILYHKLQEQKLDDYSDANSSKSTDDSSKKSLKNTYKNDDSSTDKVFESEYSESSKECYAENIETHELDEEDKSYEGKESKEMLMEELDSALERVSCLEEGLDDDTEAVANEFLNMMGFEQSPYDSEPESPRERLLRQFERETLASGTSLFSFDFDTPHPSTDSPKLSPKELEGLEAEELMREWGLSEKAFELSRPDISSGPGSPFEDEAQLPSLGEGLGSLVHTKDGGFLRSMSPKIFSNGKNGANLIMQVSRPVVVPAEMGSSMEEILHRLASAGVENLSMHANNLMPLNDIMGLSMQQIAWETAPPLVDHDSEAMLKRDLESRAGRKPSPRSRTGEASEYVSLEELAPLAIEKIEALSMEGLRIQSGMPSQDASPNIASDGAAGLHLPNAKGETEAHKDDELMGLSLTLDEWVKLDSGQIDPESDHTSKILAAHHANRAGLRQKCGLLGNNLTVALMVQLRDPFRDYEPVGVPMLAIVQVERVLDPPKPRFYRNPTCPDEITGHSDEKDEDVTLLKIAEVHVAGLKTEPGKRVWGTPAQQRAGSRWLIANGMGKSKKDPYAKPKGFVKPVVAPRMPIGDSLWSISARIAGKIRGFSGSNLLKRNPDIIL